MQYFVTGTDTDVGKTVIAAALTLRLNAHYWKPIQSGSPTDTEWVQRITELPPSHFLPEKYLLKEPLSPHLAAHLESKHISLNSLTLPTHAPLIIEGAGGVMVSLNESDLMIDLMKQFNIPVIVVCRSTLGTINHTLLTLSQLRSHNIAIAGVIVNGPKNPANCEAITSYGDVPILSEVDILPEINRSSLMQISLTLPKTISSYG